MELHHLRHFYASGLITSSCDVVTVHRALGHASATTTLNTYSHLWPTAEDCTRRVAEQLVADSSTPTGQLTRADPPSQTLKRNESGVIGRR